MKNLTFWAAACASLFLFSCSKDETTDNSSAPGSPATLKIILAGAPESKAAGAPVTSDESKIAKGIIFVFRGTGQNPVLDGKASFDFSSGTTNPVAVNITAGTARHVYVIANIANTTDFDGVNKLSDLYNLTNKYQLSSMLSGSNLGMSGHTDNVDASAATAAAPASATVVLKYLGSRVHINWDISQIPSNMTGFSITGAYLLNVKSQTDYFSAPSTYLTYNVNSYLRGKSDISTFTGSYLPVSPATNTYSASLVLGNLSTDKGFDKNYFYVMENNSPAPTIVVLEGTLNSTVYYYPIVINGDQNGSGSGGATNPGDKSSVISRGNIYYVNGIIKGFGNSDPYEPLKKAAINVTVTPAAWNPTIINIDQEFN